MMSSNALFNSLIGKVNAYKKKYYLNILIRGIIFFLVLISSTFITFSFLEYFGRLQSSLRLALFTGYIGIALFGLYKWILNPILELAAIKKPLSDEEASKQIGIHFPNIGDKLLNTLQLGSLSHHQNALIEASIVQKTKELSVVPFIDAVKIEENKRYLKFLVFPIAIIIGVLFFLPNIFIDGTTRIVNYNKNFPIPAPFQFVLNNSSLQAFKNEDFEVKLAVKGDALPDNVYIINNGVRSKMKKDEKNLFLFNFKNLQSTEKFIFEAAGFNSKDYLLNVVSKPSLNQFTTTLSYPAYLNKKAEVLKNAGNITIPEGTTVSWDLQTTAANTLTFIVGEETPISLKESPFKVSKKVVKSGNYQIELENDFGKSSENINYYIEVIPDQFPQVTAEKLSDSTLFNFVSVAGSISDDYGLTKLLLHYSLKDKDGKAISKKAIRIPFDSKYLNQNYFYNWNLDTLKLEPGESLEYFVEVWDNDGVNGSKSSKSSVFEFRVPSKDELATQIGKSSEKTESKIDNVLSKTNNLQKDLDKLQDKLKSKNNLNWQDKKKVEDLLKQHNELKNELEELSKLNKELQQKSDKLQEPNPELKEKMEQLQKLMDELLDEQTKKLYEELEKLLKDNRTNEEIQKVLEQIKKKDENLENELSRTLEMFKELKFEQKLNQTIEQLKEKAKEQEDLAEKSLNKDANQEELKQKQEQLNEDFKKIEESLKELSDINKELENKKDLENNSEKQEQIKNDLNKSLDQLNNKQNKKASSSQKDASKKMSELSQKLSQMQEGMEMQQMQENMDDLRNILENLLKLSFDQEDLMKEFKTVHQSDPRFITLSQKQLKLKDDSEVIEDSLLALSKRVFQIKSFVTREVTKMKNYMDESTDALKARRPDMAVGKQQFAMTSINNLALMLNDVLKQMQEQMAQAMQNKQPGGKQSCKKPGSNPQPGGLGDLQKQLNEKIQQLKQSGKSGKELSQELAKLAAQQEMIRNAIKELEGKMGKDGKKPGNSLDGLKKQMEETESDLVNKQLSQQTLMRQKEILTRLLEAEKAVRERELDDKREAESAKEQNQISPALEKYLKEKEKQIDLLKTVSPSLNQYYKHEVDEYFQKIEK